MPKSIRIGGASGFWGESMMATPQLLKVAQLDYLVYDFLAEITMSIMARARIAKPEMGYATDFISGVLKPNLQQIAAQGVKVLTNAGGVNPTACGTAARALIAEQGLDLKVAVVSGDDLLAHSEILAETPAGIPESAKFSAGFKDMFSGADFPGRKKLVSANAYFGGFPVAAALAAGADIVITGRSVDSAVTLGACIHAFGWTPQDYDALAGGSLAGHIIECGPQATGGNFTDWHLVKDSLANIGYPFIDIDARGAFSCAKPEGTGGIVSVGTVSEQMLYEIGDPQAYLLPDVTCDFSAVTIEQKGDNLVYVSNAKGRAPGECYKVSATYTDGFRAGTLVSFVGFEAPAKARVFAEAAFARAGAVFRQRNMADFEETSIEIIGDDSQYGATSSNPQSREVVLKIAAKHTDMAGAQVLLKEITGLALATPAGLSIFAGSRPKPSPVVRLFSFLIPKKQVPVVLDMDGVQRRLDMPESAVQPAPAAPLTPATLPDKAAENLVHVPLIKLAWGRSGDKGDKANIGIIARDAAWLPYIWAVLDEACVAARFAHFIGRENAVQRFYLPGSHAINFLIDGVLGGGGVASLRNDPQGKAFAQILLDHPIPVPASIAEVL